ncbi:MAG: hypothetical protein EZS28_032583, partial [Streblomastix strix]
QFNILFINDGINAHIMYISDVEALTGFRYCNICHRQAFRIGDKNLQVQMRNHMKKCQKNDGKIIKKVILEKFAKPFVPHILSNKTYKKKINKKFNDCSQVNATLVPYSIASIVKSANGIHSFYYDIRTDYFLDKWLEQYFEETKQIWKDNKYKDETIPQYYEVRQFHIQLVFKNLKSKDWTISKLKDAVRDFGNGSYKKSKIPNKKLSEDKYKEYLVETTKILFKPIDFLINLIFKYKVDTLTNMSMAQCANVIKYVILVVNQMYLFVAEVRGHIDESYLNEVSNYAPILRNTVIKTNNETIGEFMYHHIVEHKLPHDTTERKLINLVDTNERIRSEPTMGAQIRKF